MPEAHSMHVRDCVEEVNARQTTCRTWLRIKATLLQIIERKNDLRFPYSLSGAAASIK